jgi:hypothetical protein
MSAPVVRQTRTPTSTAVVTTSGAARTNDANFTRAGFRNANVAPVARRTHDSSARGKQRLRWRRIDHGERLGHANRRPNPAAHTVAHRHDAVVAPGDEPGATGAEVDASDCRLIEDRVDELVLDTDVLSGQTVVARDRADDRGTRGIEIDARVGEAPEAGLDGIEQWGARARTALFAKRTHAEGERAQVLHEVAEIGSSALGEPMFSGSVSAVRSRVEAAVHGA